MIEQFTPQELEIIKRELGVYEKHKAHKRYLYDAEYQRIKEATKSCELIKAQSDVWYGVCALCDHAFHNYRKSGKSLEIRARYSTVWDDRREEYGNMARELIDVFEKYKRKYEHGD